MNELEFQEEWLSAYLDDELTDEQRLVVEQRLAIDPAAQATLDDLQRVRAMVSKLPNWSGSNLKFAVPSDALGSFDHSDEEVVDNDSDDELDDFEEVPRLIAGVEERRDPTHSKSNSNSKSRSTRTRLGWLATAASILLVAGIGYLNWPSGAPQVAMNQPPLAAAKKSLGAMPTPTSDPGIGSSGELALGGALESESSNPIEGQAENRLAEKDVLNLPAEKSAMNMPRASVAQGGEEQLNADKKESKMKVDSYAPSAPPQQMSRGGLPGGFGGGANRDLALGLPSEAPVVDLPQPSPSILPRSLAESSENNINSDDSMRDRIQTQRNGLTSPGVYFARSKSWMDEEAKSSLPYGATEYSANQIAFGSNNAFGSNTAFGRNTGQRGTGQIEGEAASERVLMAGIKPEIANSPVFFQDIVTSNNLIAVDQQPALNQLSNANQMQTSNFAAPTNRDASGTIAPLVDAANAPVSNMFSNQRSQLGTPNSPQGNSYVLFLNRDEATQILSGLQEKGQVSSVWRVRQLETPMETQTAIGSRLNVPSPTEPQKPADGRTAGESLNGRIEPATNDKIILMLNGPPN